MFAVGQLVWTRVGRRSGIVLECDGDRVYIEQANGAELDFPARDLTAERPAGDGASGVAGADGVAAAASAARAMQTRRLTPRDITPAHAKVLAAIPVRTLQAVAVQRPGHGGQAERDRGYHRGALPHDATI